VRRTTGPPAYPTLGPFAQRLEEFRHARRLTQRALAERVGISTNHYQDIAHAEGNPTAVVLLRMAAALGVTVGDLFDATPSRLEDTDQTALLQLLHHVEHAALHALSLRALALFD
jgi:transcriptional regulator with XRE-family HTH domain